MQPEIPQDEAARLEALRLYNVLDTGPEEAFDRITKLARHIFNVPIAMVTLIDSSRQWFKSRYGLDIRETERDISFCAHTILDHCVMMVPDATQDGRFRHNPLVTGYPDVRFYAGAPLTTPDGYNIGTLAIIDTHPRPELSTEQVETLTDLAALVVDELELRFTSRRLRIDMLERERVSERAQENSRAKSEFLSRMSHELRTPLTAILGFGQLLEMSDLDAADADAVHHILTAGNHLLSLINDVLDISRVEAGRLLLSIEPVGVQPLVDEVFTLLQTMARERKVTLERSSKLPAGLLVRADNQRLKQVLLNLVSNAIKYNREGGTVRLSCQGVDDAHVSIRVTDTGPGIPKEKCHRLFQPFDRLDADQSGIEGTGLGLALSKQLMEAMGGTIDVESRVGEGSTFVLSLPRDEMPVLPDEQPAHQESASEADYGQEERYTLLYIEDNLPNLTLLKRILSYRTDLRILTAMQGRLGLDLAKTHKPDLVLLDLNLPGMNGDEILREIRRNPETRDMKVIMLSADATPGQVKRLLEEGADAYLTKPFDILKIREAVDEALDPSASSAKA
jgi:signal transduction histidine kinase/ActR/RegA family two-component response regulator